MRGLVLAICALLLCVLLSTTYGQDQVYDEGGEAGNGEDPTSQLIKEEDARERARLAALEAELEAHLRLEEGQGGGEGEGAIPGQPEEDYPVFTRVPRTSFTCADKHVPGYYADTEARCQAFHICDAGGAKHSFLCPGGSVFNQKFLVCDWWYGFVCDEAPHLFSRQRDAAAAFQGESRRFKQRERQELVFAANPEQSNFVFLPGDVFHVAETGVPNRERFQGHDENFRNGDNKDSLKDAIDQKDSRQEPVSETNNFNSNRNVSSEVTNKKEHPEDNMYRFENRKPLKSVLRKKQYNDRLDQKKDLNFTPKDIAESSSTAVYNSRGGESLSFENFQNVQNQLLYTTVSANEYFPRMIHESENNFKPT